MRTKTTILLALSLSLSLAVIPGCHQKSDLSQPIVIEERSPAVGADGKLAQSIGIETLGGVFTPILQQGCDVPCSKAEIFSTATDNQDQITVRPFRGNATLAADCDRLGQFRVVGVPGLPRGVPQIEITFSVRDGNVLLSAKDLASGKTMLIVRGGSG